MPGEPRAGVDSSVVVAGLLTWHEKHEAAAQCLERCLTARSGLIVPAHALTEAYSVMTRLPRKMRIAPEAAIQVLTGTFKGRVETPSLGGEQVWEALGTLAEQSLGGGLVFDCLILATARLAGARRLYTFNVADFKRLPDAGVEILEPA